MDPGVVGDSQLTVVVVAEKLKVSPHFVTGDMGGIMPALAQITRMVGLQPVN